MTTAPASLRSGLVCHLFIYLVRRRDGVTGYCTVLAYGRSLEAAERIAINRVHQESLHIVRADTATAAPWVDPARDRDYLAELAREGSALRWSEVPVVAPAAATAA